MTDLRLVQNRPSPAAATMPPTDVDHPGHPKPRLALGNLDMFRASPKTGSYSPLIICVLSLAVIVACVGWAKADTFGPGEMVPVGECSTYVAPTVLGPQRQTPARGTFAEYVADPQRGAIRYPTYGTGGSGGHEPDVDVPAPVPLPGAGGLLMAAMVAFGAWRKWA